MMPKNGLEDWEVTLKLAEAVGYGLLVTWALRPRQPAAGPAGITEALRATGTTASAAGRALIETAMAETVASTGAWLRAALCPEEIHQLTGLLARLAETGNVQQEIR